MGSWFPGAMGRGKWEETANEYEVSFQGDEMFWN